MPYIDHSNLKPYLQAEGLSSAKIKRAQTILKRKNELEKLEGELRQEWDSLLDSLDNDLRNQAIAKFKKESGIAEGEAYIATPKFAGKVLNVVVTRIGLNYRKEPYLCCALVRPNGSIRETKELYLTGYDFTPAKNIVKKS